VQVCVSSNSIDFIPPGPCSKLDSYTNHVSSPPNVYNDAAQDSEIYDHMTGPRPRARLRVKSNIRKTAIVTHSVLGNTDGIFGGMLRSDHEIVNFVVEKPEIQISATVVVTNSGIR